MKHFKDEYYSKKKLKRVRHAVRCILVNEKGQLGYLHINALDRFGFRDHFEAVGGGILFDESHYAALNREILEETGYLMMNAEYLETVSDLNYPLSRFNIHHYYIVNVIKKTGAAHTCLEKHLIKGLVWDDPQQWIHRLTMSTVGINAQIHRRELYLLKHYLKLTK